MNKFVSILVLMITSLMYFCAATAQGNYPNKAIRILVPFAAGGPTDIVTRKLSEQLAKRFGQPVIVDNRPGGSTLIATEAVLNSPPDGYTILVTNTQLVQLPALMPNISYVPERDFLPVAQICSVPLVLTTNALLPISDIASFIGYHRANPDKVNYGSSGYGGTSNIYAEELLRRYDLKAELIVYKGEAPIVPEILANRVQWYFATPSQVFPYINQGKLRAIAVTGTDRLSKLPNVPTMGELGAETFNTVGWFAMFLPARTPRPIAERLSKEVLAVTRSPEFTQFLEANMFGAKGIGIEEFAPDIARISAIWTRMIRENNIRIR